MFRWKTTKEFKIALKKVNPSIDVIGGYIKNSIPISVCCKKCGHIWSPTPNSLLRGTGCPNCYGNIHKTTEQFKTELAQINPNIEVVGKYINSRTSIEVCCKVCGHTWSPKPNHILQGSGCPKCAKQRRCRSVKCVEMGETYQT